MTESKRPKRTQRDGHRKRNPTDFDSVLIAAQAGSTAAFEELFNLLAGRLTAYARSRRATDPEGLVNEVFLRVFRGIGAFSGNEPQFNAWIFTIARNQLIDEGRKRQRRPVETSESQTPPSDSAVENVEDEVLVRLDTEHLLAQLDVLTADQRDVVLLRIVADLTIDATAAALGKEPGAVKALQRRAFKNLANHLSQATEYPYG